MTPEQTSVYLAGPMTGIPQFNFPVFDAAAKYLRGLGFIVHSPAEMDDPATREQALASPDGAPGSGTANGETYGDFLSRDIKIVLDEVDGIVMLPQWWQSSGACIELFTALRRGKFAKFLHRGELHDIEIDRAAAMLARSLRTTSGAYRAQSEAPATSADPGPVPPPEELQRRGDSLAKALAQEEEVPGDTVESFASREERISALAMEHPDAFKDERETRVTSETGGQKGRKPERLGLVPKEPLWELGRVYGFGAEKYDDHNYLRGYDWSLSIDAAERHFSQWQNGEDLDGESGLHHLAHAAWHMFALMMFQWHDLGTDTRLPTVVEGLEPQRIDRTGRSEAART